MSRYSQVSLRCLTCRDDILGKHTVNGVPLNESSYLYAGDAADSTPGFDARFNVTVPKGYLWVIGDHRSVSEGSRAHIATGTEFVPVGDVVGKADVIVWPASQWSMLPVLRPSQRWPWRYRQPPYGVGAGYVTPDSTVSIPSGGQAEQAWEGRGAWE